MWKSSTAFNEEVRMARSRGPFVLLCVALISFAGCSERELSVYSTIGDARQDGALARGWLPDYIPESATNIREFHFVDSSESWTSFECPDECMRALNTAAKPVDLAPPPRPRDTRIPWPDHNESLTVRAHHNSDVILIDDTNAHAYVWRRLQ